jgi:hypothetical protein
MEPKRRIFLSAVTSEFGQARDALAGHLKRQGFEPVWQPEFPDHANADSLQSMLRDLVDSSDAIICLQGRRAGTYPPPAIAARFDYWGRRRSPRPRAPSGSSCSPMR